MVRTFYEWTNEYNPLMWAGSALGITLLGYLLYIEQYTLLCTLVIACGLLMIAAVDKAKAALLTLAYLHLMGDIRRAVAVVAGFPANDPLLLVGPVFAAVLAIPILATVRLKDTLSKIMLLLLAIMTLEIFNPKQGGLAVGLSGALFYIAPMLWFWIGRSYATPQVIKRLIYNYVLPLALLAAVLGLAQTFIGFLPYEQAWIDVASKTYTALFLGGSIRAFGFSVSGAEYATLLGLGAAVAVAAWLGSQRIWMLAFPIFATALVIASSRGVALKVIVTLALLWTLRKGGKVEVGTLVRLGLCAIIGLALVSFTASHFAPAEDSSSHKTSAVQDAVAHETGGLAHPFDKRYSTAGVHSSMLTTAIVQGFTYPIGYGLGSTTRAAAKFGSNPDLGSSEVDLSDMFLCLGCVGGLTYVGVIVLTFRRLLVYLRAVPRAIGLPVVAMLACTLGSWLIGGQYSTSSLLFFMIGGLVCDVRS